MCFTYRILEPIDSNIHLSMFSPALEKLPFKAEVEFPSVHIMQSTPFETVGMIENSDSSDDDDDEFFDAQTGEDLEWLKLEDLQELSPIEEDWAQEDANIHTEKDHTDTEADNTEATNTEEGCTQEEPDHPLAGWHSDRLAKSDWTDHSFVDKSDHIDIWARHSENSLARCTWSVFPESAWPKPKDDSFWGAPELRLVTPEGEVCWLDDPTDYEALPWEREVAEERDRILAAIW